VFRGRARAKGGYSGTRKERSFLIFLLLSISRNTERGQLALLLLGRAAHGVRRLPADLERRAAAGLDAKDVDDLGDAGALVGG